MAEISTMHAYESGFVRRYHQSPRLARHNQTDGQHAFGVAAIVNYLTGGNMSYNLLYEAVFHDIGERIVGDLSGPFRRANPEFAEMHRKMEAVARAQMDMPIRTLTDDERVILKVADQLECILFVGIVDNDTLCLNDWMEYINATLDLANTLGLRDVASDMLGWCCTHQGVHP